MTRPAAAAVVAGSVTGILVGAAMVATRHVVDDAGPATLALWRYGIGMLGLLPWALAGRWVSIDRRDLLAIGLLGIGQFAVLIVLLNTGLRDVEAGIGALLFATLPLMAMAIGSALGREAFTWGKLFGIGLSVCGVGLVVLDGLGPGQWRLAPTGVAAILCSALVGAICAVYYRAYVERYPPLQVCVLAMLASLIFLLPLAQAEAPVWETPAFSSSGWAAVMFIGFASSLGYATWLYALKHATPTRVCLFLALGPVTAAFLGAVLLGEAVSGAFGIGLALVVLGLLVAHLPVADRTMRGSPRSFPAE